MLPITATATIFNNVNSLHCVVLSAPKIPESPSPSVLALQACDVLKPVLVNGRRNAWDPLFRDGPHGVSHSLKDTFPRRPSQETNADND